jgi:hypothetical protein
MKIILATLIMLALPIAAIADDRRPAKPQPQPRVKSNPCAAFGPGFVQVDGTSTCVKVGGGIDVGVGIRPSR